MPRISTVDVVVLVSSRAFAAPLSYLDDPAAPLPVGAVVRAPLRGRTVGGVVVATGLPAPERVDAADLRPVEDTGQRVPADLVELALDIAARYATTPARALALVLPPGPPPASERWATLVDDADVAGVRGARRRAVVEALGEGPLRVDALREATGAGAATVRELEAAGVIALADAPPPVELRVAAGPQLTAAQAAAVARVEAALAAPPEDGPRALLLHGVTGSGKTEVFLRGVETALRRGRTAVVLVPEIALAPQTAGRVAERFGALVAVLHSGLAGGARDAALRRLARGEARIAVGPRSALLAPLADLGLIVVDEEHDAAYKQDADPRYDARAVALVRARMDGAVVLFASATPRPESWHALPRITLPERVAGPLPPVEIVDLRRDGAYPVSHRLGAELRALEQEGGRAILLLNRRGEAPALHCRGCGSTFRCSACDVALTLHARPPGLRCHHCGRRSPVPRRCPTCGAVDIARVGAGTERLEHVLREGFPELALIRLDADVVARRGALEEGLERFRATDRSVLLGTQMVAKGHDFPDVRLAAVIDADAGQLVPDFRAEERTFALLTQLAGRAAREGGPARVLVQAWEPGARAVRRAVRHDVAGFLDDELQRRALLGYPPFRRLVRVLVTTPTPHEPLDLLRTIAAEARAALAGDDVLGPAALVRLRGRERAHLLVKTERPRRAAAMLGDALARHARALRGLGGTSVVDVDPQSL